MIDKLDSAALDRLFRGALTRDLFIRIGRVWETKVFEVRNKIANEHSVAMFGS